MNPLTLTYTTGSKEFDEDIIAVITLFEAAFPEAIRAYYLEGSLANNTAVTTSDIDLHIIYKEKTVHERVRQVVDACTKLSKRELDISIQDEASLTQGVVPIVKASRLLYGDDILAQVPLISIEQWTRDRMHACYWLLNTVFQRPRIVQWPITYPDLHGEFYGYDNRKVITTNGIERNSTRNLIRVTGWMATARIALEAQQYISNKYECYAVYRQLIGDEWSSFIEETYALCRERWNYLVPDELSARVQLKSLCARALEWENHFLQVYKRFLLTELQDQDNPLLERILWIQENIPYDDQEIQATLQKYRR
ncbi:nucleotidyltransferase domain-containing protein [Ktedonobacteria bacterium brp13]|nr:nucleotidyltransferase domain-containing protein [Ktedonobacteria bacterium brp13]